ncbi:hypothetical protein [Tahibacter amnicola]|uniref:Uncharacterized protein n=1 Tax=Tahibacter amnicola TaxID=2976241 RepID=A0ABY6BF27_9GAMM|nr:hypothetical protein [Tahibacter amnicola]UXI68415.1 hypothetical protein N4264_01810 [Tahibacter amnicola]
MWKLLRNLLLTALLLVGGAKLALWAAAYQQAGVMAQLLQPWGTLNWSSASGRLNGSIRLTGVRFVPKAPLPTAPIDAAAVVVQTPGPFWLLRRAVMRDVSPPEELAVSLEQSRVPFLHGADGKGVAEWIGDVSLLPFEAMGCGSVTRMSEADFKTMGVTYRLPTFTVDYRYDSNARSLVMGLSGTNEAFGSVRIKADLSEFSPQIATNKTARDAVRIGAITLRYQDHGYLAKRNQFCAGRRGDSNESFIEAHIGAVQDFLKERHVVPAEGVIELYRALLVHGGSVELLSLPNVEVAPAQYARYDPEEVLRWLNLTLRHNDAPPVLFKLFFLATEPTEALAGIDKALMHDPLAEPAPEPEKPPPAEPPVTPPPATTSPLSPVTTATAAVTPPPPVAPATPARPPVAPATAPRPPTVTTVTAPPASSTASTATTTPPPVTSPRPTATPPRPAATASATQTAPTLRVTAPREDPRVAGRSSAPPPPPGSTAALVWQGAGIDRLPTDLDPVEKPYTVIAYANAGQYAGAFVTLITSGGKEIEGRITSVDDEGIALSVQKGGGQARFFVERSRILEIRLLRKRA